MFHFAYFYFFLFGIVSFTIALAIRLLWPQQVMYRYSLVHLFITNKMTASFQKHIFSFLRIVSLILMLLLVGKPQIADQKSHVHVDGIDIMLALDVSGSMSCLMICKIKDLVGK